MEAALNNKVSWEWLRKTSQILAWRAMIGIAENNYKTCGDPACKFCQVKNKPPCMVWGDGLENLSSQCQVGFLCACYEQLE